MSIVELKSKPCPDTVQQLEQMLKMAREGDLTSFVAFGAGTDAEGHKVIYDWTGGKVHLPTLAWAYRMWEVEQAK